MAAGTKSFVFNRESNWRENGLVDNFAFIDDQMVLESNDSRNGYYISTSLDSGEKENVWDRMRLKANFPPDSIIRVSFYASDDLYITVPVNAKEKIEINLDEYIMNSDIPLRKRLNILKGISSTKEFDNPNDVLLYSLKGRYLWFSIEVVSYTSDNVNIESIKIEFPRNSFIRYLPEIYQDIGNDAFLSRFIGVFESVYLDIEEKIDNMPRMFDPMIVDAEFLRWIAKWFSIKENHVLSEDKLRLLVKSAVKLYKIKGTKESIRNIVWLYTLCEAKIIEQFEVIDNDFYQDNKELVNRLFGENVYTFTVILDNSCVKNTDEYAALIKLINLFKPADSKCNLVILNNNIYLDYHCYLGINSYLSHNKQIVLDGDSVLMNSNFLTKLNENSTSS